MFPAYYVFPLSTSVFSGPQMNVLTGFYSKQTMLFPGVVGTFAQLCCFICALCKSTQMVTSTTSGIRTRGRFHCQLN
ncbi:hypothetical protein T08_4710 [Trichinella sp. T8]|nr:hypothetical protein T08_4710 [Trichinella sp. T8]